MFLSSGSPVFPNPACRKGLSFAAVFLALAAVQNL
jgi:hypothetical protein